MITEPTTFVLGAGASIDYGYPSGNKLKENIVTSLIKKETREYILLKDLNFDDIYIEKFVHDFERSGKSSVDAFLEHRPEMREIGIKRQLPLRLFIVKMKGNYIQQKTVGMIIYSIG